MSVIAEAVRHMMKAGMGADAIADAVAAMEAAAIPARSKGAERTARWRHKASQSVTRDAGSPLKEIPPTPPKENNPLPASPIGSAAGAEQPSDLDRLQAKLFAAAGIENFRAERSVGLVNLAPIIGLIQQGYDLDRDILPIVENLFRRSKKPNSWAYCVNPIIEAATAKRGIPPKPKAATIDWPGALAAFRQHGIWYEQRYGPRPGEPGCRAPPELLQAA